MIQFIKWDDWHGIGLHRWEGEIARLIPWSILLGFLEVRYMRKTWKRKEER